MHSRINLSVICFNVFNYVFFYIHINDNKDFFIFDDVNCSQLLEMIYLISAKYEQICATHVTNGTEENDGKEEDETRSNALDGLSGYLSSDSSSGESELNEEVQNFLKVRKVGHFMIFN